MNPYHIAKMISPLIDPIEKCIATTLVISALLPALAASASICRLLSLKRVTNPAITQEKTTGMAGIVRLHFKPLPALGPTLLVKRRIKFEQ